MSAPVYAQLKAALLHALAQALGKPPAELEPHLTVAEPEHGELTLAAFGLARELRQPPARIAAELAGRVVVPGMSLEARGSYLNARFDPAPFATAVLASALAQGSAFGGGAAGQGKTVVIDYSSPNICKPIAYHHIRSTVLGHALANLHAAQGWRVVGINYLGDWGKQFGLVATGLAAFGDPAKRGELGHLVDVYVKASARAEAEPAFDQAARDFFLKMEQGDPAALALWQELRAASVAELERIYARLGIAFTHLEGESLYQGRMAAVIEQLRARPGVKLSQGALVVDLPQPEGEPPVLLQKADGATLYATRDLAAALDRHARFTFDRALYVVAQDQALHFRQLFRVLEAMGQPWAGACVHVGFGRVHGMSTRKGQVVLLGDVLDEAKERAREFIRANEQEGFVYTADKEVLAEQIALGAVVFGDLKNRRASDYTFDWSQVLQLEGHTGVYLQYAHARTASVLRKGGGAPGAYEPARLTLPEEALLVRQVALLPLVVAQATEALEPSLLARYLLDLAQAFNQFFQAGNQDRSKRILCEDEALRSARLALTRAVKTSLAAGLRLLGVPAPEEV